MRKTRPSSTVLILFAALFLLAFPNGGPVQGIPVGPAQAGAQEAPRDTTPQGLKKMTVDDYALWRSIGQTSLSPDGRWVTYAYSQREVDDSLFIQPLGSGDPRVVVRGSNPSFSADSRWIAYYLNPKEAEGGRARAGGPGGPAGATGGRGQGGGGQARALELFDLQTQDTVRWENVQSFGFAETGGALVVKKRKGDSDAEHDGTDLLIRYLHGGEEELISYVDEWAFDEDGGRLSYTVDSPEGESNGIHLLDFGTRARWVLDAERKVKYAQLTWGDKKGVPSADALAVLKGGEDEDLVETENALLMWPALSVSREPVVLDPRTEREESDSVESEGEVESGSDDAVSKPLVVSAGWVLSEKGALRWARDASKVFVATRPQQPAPKTLCKPSKEQDGPESPASDSADAGGPSNGTAPKIFAMASRFAPDGQPLGPEEILGGVCPEFMADVDIWHIDDERLQSVQMIRASRDRNQTYTSVVHLERVGSGSGGAGTPASPSGFTGRFVQLTDETMEAIQLSDNGRFAMGRNDKPYRSDWEPSYADYYLVDLSTGQRTPVLQKHLRTLGFSPDGNHYLYWKDRDVWSYQTETGQHLNLTDELPVTLENEEFDRLGEKPPHGIAGWTSDTASVILRHRYDLYVQPLSGGPATNLTLGQGGDREIQFRILSLDPEEELTNLAEPLVLTAYGQWTKKAGFYRMENGELQELVYDDARFGRPVKADSTDLLLFTREDFEAFPDYHVSGLDFANPVRVTNANPQQADFNWGRQILFDYETQDGVRLQGVLAIPYDYVEGEPRPMLVDFYEKNSQNLNRYHTPIFRDSPMFSAYVSAGYLVMRPDIHFRVRATHTEMLEGINLAIDKVVEMGYVDPDRIGLHGHSFSGQGSTYIATHSDRFAAIVAGAAATNLVSDFNQLWKSSGTNQHGYDTYGQGRFGTNPFDDLELFLDQSATPNAENMNTPLLILHGTADGSVEWLQAVEFYNALRWHGKDNVILMSYPGEPHHLRVLENQRDFQIRMRQFYDHYLWGKPAPKWMESGRSFLQKERDRAMVERNGNDRGGTGEGG